MPITIVCPVCAASFPAEAGLTDADARKALGAALELPAPLAVHVIPYIGLHAPAKRRIAWPKLARLISDMVELVGSGQVTRNRETRTAPQMLWAEGLAAVLEMRDAGTLDLPLEGHALLTEIVFRKANKAQKMHEARTKPLHPSHRPAVLERTRADAPAPAPAPEPSPALSPPGQDWSSRRAGGIRHIGALMGALKKTSKSTPTEEGSQEGSHEQTVNNDAT